MRSSVSGVKAGRFDEGECSLHIAPDEDLSFFEQAPAAMLFLSNGGLIHRSNTEFLQLTGYERDEIDGVRRLQDLLSDGAKVFYETHVPLLLINDHGIRGISLDLLSKTGEAIPVLLSASRRQNDEAFQFTHAIFFDARERRSYEKTLLAAHKKTEQNYALLSETNKRLSQSQLESSVRAAHLERANKDLLQFSYSVGHDLNAPLRTVITFSELLRMQFGETLRDEGSFLLESIIKGGRLMHTMLQDLMAMAQAAGGTLTLFDEVDLCEIVRSALERLRIAAGEAKAVVNYDSLPTVTTDPKQLALLFQNLIGNAIKYRKPGVPPVVTVTANREGDDWIICVRDNGIGLASNNLKKIFEIFERVDKEAAEGSGIGLAICQRIVDRLGGRIWAASELGVGSEFFFALPASNARERAAVAAGLPGDVAQAPAVVDAPKPFGSAKPSLQSYIDKFFQVLDASQAMVRNLDQTIVMWSRRCEQLFGWSKEEATGKPVHQLLKTEFPTSLGEIEAELFRTGAWSGELKKFAKDGTPVWLYSHWSLYRDGSGRPESIIEIYTDITALRVSQQSLRKAEQKLQIAGEAAELAIFEWNMKSGTLRWENDRQSHILGRASDSGPLTILEALELLHPDDVEPFRHSVQEAAQSSGALTHRCRILLPDNTPKWICVHGQIEFANDRMPLQMVGVVCDLNDQRSKEQQSLWSRTV